LEYCQYWESVSTDEPSKAVALFLKSEEAYLRSSGIIRKSNFWLGEHENRCWHGSYKLCGKDNYVNEGLYCNDLLYGPMMTDIMLECLRLNRYFVMTEDGRAMTMDELIEFVNLWIKGRHATEDFSKICEHSKHLMALRMCAFEMFGVKKRSGGRQNASQQEGIDRAKEFFEAADIFPLDMETKRELDVDFFWNYVVVPKAEGTEKDKSRKNVSEKPEMAALHQVLFEPEKVYSRRADDNDLKVPTSPSTAVQDDDNMSLNTFNMERGDRSVGVADENGPGNVEGWENVDDGDDAGDDNVNAAMKRNKMKRHPISNLILKAMVNEAKRHEKNKLEKKRPFEMIEVSCIYFESQLTKKCKHVKEDTDLAKEGKHRQMAYDFLKDYDEEMNDNQNGI
jgi:hypothetical protein